LHVCRIRFLHSLLWCELAKLRLNTDPGKGRCRNPYLLITSPTTSILLKRTTQQVAIHALNEEMRWLPWSGNSSADFGLRSRWSLGSLMAHI
jgi:hypothetical protein